MATLQKIAANNYKANQPIYDSGEVYKSYIENTIPTWDVLTSGISVNEQNGLDALSLSSGYSNGASYNTPLYGDFDVSFNAEPLDFSYFGLDTRKDFNTAFTSGDGFAFGIVIRTSSLQPIKDGIFRSAYYSGALSTSVVHKITRRDGIISIYKDGVLEYTFPEVEKNPLYIKANRYSGTLVNYIFNVTFNLNP